MLTKDDLRAIEYLLDKKLEEKLESKLEEKLESKLTPVYKKLDSLDKRMAVVEDFVKFARPALISLLEESQERHAEKLPERVAKLEELLKNN